MFRRCIQRENIGRIKGRKHEKDCLHDGRADNIGKKELAVDVGFVYSLVKAFCSVSEFVECRQTKRRTLDE